MAPGLAAKSRPRGDVSNGRQSVDGANRPGSVEEAANSLRPKVLNPGLNGRDIRQWLRALDSGSLTSPENATNAPIL